MAALTAGALQERVARLEAREEIRELVVLYGFVMDERDERGVRALFCDDATVRSADGVMEVTGREAVVEAYGSRWSALGPTNHVSHGQVIRFGVDPDRAVGLVAGHAEVVRHGTAMVVGLRYEDDYHRVDDVWRFHRREMSYLYYLPVDQYAEGLGAEGRMRAYGRHAPANWPWVLTGAGDRLGPYLVD